MAPEIYQFLERWSPLLVLWSFAFTMIHGVRIVRFARRGLQPIPDTFPICASRLRRVRK